MEQREKPQYWETADRSWSADSVWFSNTPTRQARQVFFYVQEVGHFRTVPPYYTKRANLNSFLLFYTLSGTGLLDYQGSTHVLTPGTAALVNCMEYHHYRCAPNSHWDFLWLHFNGPTALGYCDLLTKNGPAVLTPQNTQPLQEAMETILQLTQSKARNNEITVSALITQLLTRLLLLSSPEESGAGPLPEYLKKILKKLDNHFREPLQLDSLSQEFGVSKYHLCREFKRCTGSTFHEYLTVTRLNHAKELLKYSAQSIEQVAFSCGFHHVSHFINLFRSHEGMTPLQFKKEWRKQ